MQDVRTEALLRLGVEVMGDFGASVNAKTVWNRVGSCSNNDECWSETVASDFAMFSPETVDVSRCSGTFSPPPA